LRSERKIHRTGECGKRLHTAQPKGKSGVQPRHSKKQLGVEEGEAGAGADHAEAGGGALGAAEAALDLSLRSRGLVSETMRQWFLLLVAQGPGRIDGGNSQRWQNRGGQRNQGEHNYYRGESRRVVNAYAKDDAAHHSQCRDRDKET